MSIDDTTFGMIFRSGEVLIFSKKEGFKIKMKLPYTKTHSLWSFCSVHVDDNSIMIFASDKNVPSMFIYHYDKKTGKITAWPSYTRNS